MLQRGFLFLASLLACALPLVGQTTTSYSNYVHTFRFSPDAKTITGFNGETVLSWDLASRKLIRSQQAKSENATLDDQGRLLSVVGDEKGVRVMDVVAN